MVYALELEVRRRCCCCCCGPCSCLPTYSFTATVRCVSFIWRVWVPCSPWRPHISNLCMPKVFSIKNWSWKGKQAGRQAGIRCGPVDADKLILCSKINAEKKKIYIGWIWYWEKALTQYCLCVSRYLCVCVCANQENLTRCHGLRNTIADIRQRWEKHTHTK